MRLRNRVAVVLQAMLTAFALQFRFSPILNRNDYKSGMHYLYAQVTNLLGDYSFNGLLILVLVVIFICWMKNNGYEKLYSNRLLPVFFSFCLLMGRSYAWTGSWNNCFGDIFKLTGFLIALAGYAVLFRYLIAFFLYLYQKAANSKWKPERIAGFLGEKSFRNVFLLLMLVWLPVIILSYPGNFNYDGVGQVEQGFGLRPYSSHHPLFNTLILNGFVKLGELITGSCDVGLFLFILFQSAALAAALAGTVERLTKRNVSLVLRFAVVCVYVFAPMYSNIASTVIKDVLFMAAFVWYMLTLEEFVTNGPEGRKVIDWIKPVLAQALVGLLRKNGIYVVIITGIVLCLKYRKRVFKKQRVLILLCMVILPFLICQGGNEAMIYGLSAERGSVAEMLSLPFQQTARYLQLYRHELMPEEKAGIEGVLEDVEKVAIEYNPRIADPVKALYNTNAGIDELAAYFKVWFTSFFKHPLVYIEAFFIHVYGWFDPEISNAIRYEAYTELFRQGGLINGADKVLIFFYRFVEHVPFLALLENVGIYTWLLFILTGAAYRRKTEKGILLVPLFVSLLICMISPCFYLHPRYAYPIMFTIPFLCGILSEGEKRVENGNMV